MYDSSNFNSFEYIDPFDESFDYWMRCEHLGRYLFVRDSIENESTVLDVACSNGYGSRVISEVAGNVLGLDINKEYINLAKENNAKDNIRYDEFDLDNDTFKECFDYIVCFETLEHVKNPDIVLSKFYNALNDDGILFLSVPNEKFEEIIDGKSKDKYHLNVFKYKDLLNLFYSNGFNVLKVLGQSKTNKIVNSISPDVDKTDIYYDALSIGYPSDDDIDNTYSYIFVLNKGVK